MKSGSLFSKMSIQNWGPSGWNFLHAITFKYPETPSYSDRSRVYNFFNSVGYVLPCPQCSYHFVEEMNKHNPTSSIFNNKSTLSKWLVDVHNQVNRRNDKPIMSYDMVKAEYSLSQAPPVLNELSGPYIVANVLVVFILFASICVLKCKYTR